MTGRAISALLALSAAALAQAPAPSFEGDVLPILTKRCVSCHRGVDSKGRTRRPKAGLRLDGRGWIERGSNEGLVLRPGNTEASTLYSRTALPADDDLRMPARGKPLSAEQIATLRDWIDAGADFGEWRGEPGPETTAAAATTPAWLRTVDAGGKDLGPAAPHAIAKAAEASRARITPLTPKSPLLRVEFPTDRDQITDAELRPLLPIARHVGALHVGGTGITDRALSTVAARMSRLLWLDLRATDVTDKGLAALRQASTLRRLNLWGTRVSAKGVTALLAKTPELEALFVGHTEISAAEVPALQQLVPNARVLHDPALPRDLAPR
ncbi:MAG: c-type cytochrome domain-containing protein [Planctomycetota bacterium]